MDNPTERRVLKVLEGKRYEKPPVWLMRQAGRYLPEYRATRKQAGSFLDLCYTPELAIEVTMQPIRRFGFDASILFSDILVIPDALGRDVRFVEGEGPKLNPISAEEIRKLGEQVDYDLALEHLAPVLETVKGLRSELPDEVTLLGFCGAPWTVATYMIAGHGTNDQAPARLFSFKDPDAFQTLMDVLVEMSSRYLVAQLRAGADAVQIFDSWASVFAIQDFQRWCVEPVRRIVAQVRDEIPDAKIIGFPKGASTHALNYRDLTKVDCVGLDWTIDASLAQTIQRGGAVQGNLDPMRLVAGGKALDEGFDTVMETLGQGPLIFNLGHGITPQAPIENVDHLLNRIRNG